MILTDIKIFPVKKQGSNIVAIVNATHGAIKLSSMRLMNGKDGLWLAMPSQKKEGSDRYYDYFYFATKEQKEKATKEVIDAYNEFEGIEDDKYQDDLPF